MAGKFTCTFAALCCLALRGSTGISNGLFHHFRHIKENYFGMDVSRVLKYEYIEWLELERTLKIIKFQPGRDTSYQSRTTMYVPPPHSTTKPGFPVPMDTDNPGVRKAARFGVYRYNNGSNDLFLFKESQISKAMVQIVRGLKYMLHVEIGRTTCEKREHSNLDSCHFQKKKKLQQILKCYFEVWITPWLHKVHVPIALCH